MTPAEMAAHCGVSELAMDQWLDLMAAAVASGLSMEEAAAAVHDRVQDTLAELMEGVTPYARVARVYMCHATYLTARQHPDAKAEAWRRTLADGALADLDYRQVERERVRLI